MNKTRNEAIKALKRASKALYECRRTLASSTEFVPGDSITRIAVMQSEICSLMASIYQDCEISGTFNP